MQTRLHSLLEAALSTLIGFVTSLLANLIVLPLFGFAVTLGDAFWIGVAFTLMSVARSYAVRRLFNWMHHR